MQARSNPIWIVTAGKGGLAMTIQTLPQAKD
jgi:hypothetical protein